MQIQHQNNSALLPYIYIYILLALEHYGGPGYEDQAQLPEFLGGGRILCWQSNFT